MARQVARSRRPGLRGDAGRVLLGEAIVLAQSLGGLIIVTGILVSRMGSLPVRRP
jgi:hypothetical protein